MTFGYFHNGTAVLACKVKPPISKVSNDRVDALCNQWLSVKDSYWTCAEYDRPITASWRSSSTAWAATPKFSNTAHSSKLSLSLSGHMTLSGNTTYSMNAPQRLP